MIASLSSGGRFHDFDFYGDHHVDDEDGAGVWRMFEVWKFVGGDQSPVGEINLTHKLPRGVCAEPVGPRGEPIYEGRKRERNERRPRCAHIKISLHLRRVKRGWAERTEEGDRGKATGVLISALFPKGEPRQPGTRQITFPRFALYPRPILGVEVVELTARFDTTLSVRMLKSRGWSQGCLKGCYRRREDAF